MNLHEVYGALSDLNRLRIMHLLAHGPLCVQHLQRLLSTSQVSVSKRLGILRALGMVEVVRHRNFMVYRVSRSAPVFYARVIDGIRECGQDVPELRQDLAAREMMREEIQKVIQAAEGAPLAARRRLASAPPPSAAQAGSVPEDLSVVARESTGVAAQGSAWANAGADGLID